ncbi:MAG: thiolase family protein [Thermoplasmata archaeon]
MARVAVIEGKRTPFGRLGGTLKEVRAPLLASITIRNLIETTNLQAEKIEELIMASSLTAGQSQNPAKQAAVYAGLKNEVNAYEINQSFTSGMMGTIIAYNEIKAELRNSVIVSGVESMSMSPYILPPMRFGAKFGNVSAIDTMVYDGLWEFFSNQHIGMFAENLAQKYNLSKSDLDLYAYENNKRALDAKSKISDEIVPVKKEFNNKKDFVEDECVDQDLQPEKLTVMPPLFKEEGKITAGNSFKIADGAASILLSSEQFVQENNLPVLGYIGNVMVTGNRSENFLESPVSAVKSFLEKNSISIDTYDLIEYNELYSVSGVVLSKELSISKDKMNVNGGTTSIGCPIGASSLRAVISLLKELKRRNLKTGLAVASSPASTTIISVALP